LQDVERRLRRAGRSPWPDLLVPAIVLAYRAGDADRAASWLSAIKASRKPQQNFHSIAVYRQLRRLLAPAEGGPTLDAAGSAALEWTRTLL
jgi:hypothetical protein